ncbi:P-loop containing nucleoside triphosphate hydrolase protein [Gymnopilus junonius]|uniref:P-loop containing nucleoside triphosphate hydrolase protein n=1 Tax=Gymnopilus junonius TaxID=109634 RepID=A0A9P5NVZ1_GYMJU|nr:P-loop containing nucleoside triphosphate hydrolase protein [Gymnopilus junonius]
MASPILIAQQIFSALSNSNSNHIGCLNATATNATLHSAHSTALPISATSFISLLVSYSALQEWLKLLLFGGILESLRRLGLHLYYKIYGSFFITARFEEDDSSFDWMMLWLSKQPSWKNARDVEISTRSFEEDDLTALLNRDRQLAYLPSEASVHHLWYKRHWVRVTRIIRQGILSSNHRYQTAQQNTISIYTSDSNNSWRHMASRPKRPLKSIVLDHGIKDLLIDDARDFLASKAWYAARGIPFRRGYLLYGVPGSGKTSIIHGLAGELGLDVYIVSLSRSLLDDTALNELISDLPEAAKDIKDEKDKPKALSTSKVSLSGLLNALDGVGAQEGRILFATTNKYSSLDPALCRPGRMDIHVHFKLASKYQARELYRCFYLPEEEEHADDDESPVIADSGYVSEEEKVARSSSSDEDTAFPIKSADFSGYSHHARAPKLSSAKVATLAAKFAGAIPEREFSMAALQGYLMAFKTRPYDAVRDAPEWVKKERAEMAKKMELSTSSEAVKENSET